MIDLTGTNPVALMIVCIIGLMSAYIAVKIIRGERI